MPSDDELNELLDQALTTYSDAEPLLGLEARVLQRVKTDRRRAFHLGGLAACCAVALLAVALMIPGGHRTQKDANDLADSRGRVALPIQPAPLTELRVADVRSFRDVKRSRQNTWPVSKREFPTPTPMTAEEKALVRLVNQAPAETTKLLAGLEKSAAPIEIEPIRIEPLTIDDSNKSQ